MVLSEDIDQLFEMMGVEDNFLSANSLVYS